MILKSVVVSTLSLLKSILPSDAPVAVSELVYDDTPLELSRSLIVNSIFTALTPASATGVPPDAPAVLRKPGGVKDSSVAAVRVPAHFELMVAFAILCVHTN